MLAFEEAIKKIDNEISIRKEDRQSYSKDFDIIRKHIFDIMGRQNSDFQSIYNGPSLFGSYLENIKIDKPDEFDVHFILNLPHNDKLIVRPDSSRPGFVNLDLTEVLRHSGNGSFYRTFVRLVDNKNFLDRKKLQDWIEEILDGALQRFGSTVHNGSRQYKLTYSKCATAHTVKASSNSRKMSIDFVPAFLFTKNEAKLLGIEIQPWVKKEHQIWFAVPKPTVVDGPNRHLTFSFCAPQVEKHLLVDKYNLKPSLRLFKSLRDKMGDDARKIKSYFIKNIYLLENDKQGDAFWRQPIGKILLHMLDELIDCLKKKNIPFYWAKNQNLLGSAHYYEIKTMLDLFEHVKNKLERMSIGGYVDYRQIRSLFDDSSDTVNALKA